MSRKKKDREKDRIRRPDTRRFVQTGKSPSVGVEVTTARAWTGIDQQVGHGSADALFALTDEQYASMLRDGGLADRSFVDDCWRGARDDLRLFGPDGGAWLPEHWSPHRTRMLPSRTQGEIWRHIDALGEPADSEPVELSRSLAAGSAPILDRDDGAVGMTFGLIGDSAYPRPAALIAGLDAGSDRERAVAVLGDPVTASTDEFTIEGNRVILTFSDQGLAEIVLERPASPSLPHGALGTFLAALGEPEEGAAFHAAVRLAGGRGRRWGVTPGFSRRLLVFDGVEMQVEDAAVLSIRITLSQAFAHMEDLIPGVAWPASRSDVHRALGAPVASHGGTDLHRYGHRDLLVGYDLSSAGATPTEMTAVITGVTVNHEMQRWRSGQFTHFVDALGREQTHPLVTYVRGLRGVRIRMSRGVVSEVEIDDRSGDFGGLIDGLPDGLTRKSKPFGTPSYHGDHDDVWDFGRGVIHAHAPDGDKITRFTFRTDFPDNINVRAWMWHRDG